MNVIVYVGTRASREVSYTSGYVCLMYILGQDAKVFDRHDISVIVSGDIFCQIFLLDKDSCIQMKKLVYVDELFNKCTIRACSSNCYV